MMITAKIRIPEQRLNSVNLHYLQNEIINFTKNPFDTFTSLFQLRKINRENKRNLDEKPTVLNNISSVELNQKYGIKTLVGIKPIVWN